MIIIKDDEISISDYKKCPICGKTKRKLYEYNGKDLCEDCLMIKFLYDDIIQFRDESELDTFARLNSFYSYKGGAQHFRTFFQILMVDLWSLKTPDIERIRKIWDSHYKKYSLNDMIKAFIDMEIFGPIKKDEEGKEYCEWGRKINYLITKWEKAQKEPDVNDWFYDISNIIKTAEAMIGMYDELERKTIDKNRWAIMKVFSKKCCDSEGKIKDETKIYDTPEKGGYICKFKLDNGTFCNLKKDYPEDIYVHLGNAHNVPKEDKEKYIERKIELVGIKVPLDILSESYSKKTYTSFPKLMSSLVKHKGFFTEIGNRGWLVHPNVAFSMEKALIKTKEFIKEKLKVKEKEIT